MRRALAVAVSGLVAACGAAPPPADTPPAAPSPGPAVLAVFPTLPAGLERFVTSVNREVLGPAVTTTLDPALPDESPDEAATGTEAVVEFTLPPSVFIGRMATGGHSRDRPS